MVHWLDDVMPLQSGGDQCAVLMRIDTTQWGGRCHRLPVVEARWRFEEGIVVLRWCADHGDVLMRRDRCLQVRPLQLAGVRYEADVEDQSPNGQMGPPAAPSLVWRFKVPGPIRMRNGADDRR